MAEEKEQSSYWLLSDDRLNLCCKKQQQGIFKAHFKHALLFNRRLVVPDSYVINNYNFRYAIRHDKEIQQLINDQVLCIARRCDDQGVEQSLVQIRDEMQEDKRPKEFSKEEYDSNDDLGFVDQVVQTLPYSFNDVSDRYATKAVDVFQSSKAIEKLGEDVATVITRLSREASGVNEDGSFAIKPEDRSFGRAFYFYKLKEMFHRVTGKDWKEYEKDILGFANAPYLTALPSLLELEPIYAPQHKEAFEIVRSSKGDQSKIVDQFSFSSRLGLGSFVKGLELLSCDDLHWLIETDEARHLSLMLSDEEHKVEGQSIAVAICSYQRRIEDRIMQRFEGLSADSSDGNEKRIQISLDDVASYLNDTCVYLSVAFSSLSPLSILGVVFTKPVLTAIKHATGMTKREKEEEKALQQQEVHRQNLKEIVQAEFMKEECPDRIDTVGYWGEQGKEILYKDII